MSALPPRILPNLPAQFMPPEGWRDGMFERDSRRLAYGIVMPKSTPRACVVIHPGRAECREKYFETMRDLLSRDMGVFIMDGFGQGSSGRHLSNTHMDHSRSFDERVADFNAFLRDIVTPHLHGLGLEKTPLIFLGHSMGGHIGLRYLMSLQQVFNGAVLAAPMFGIHALSKMDPLVSHAITSMMLPFHSLYVPAFWQGDWLESTCPPPGAGVLSSDALRDSIQNAWFIANPHLRVGAPTWGWLHHALNSCDLVRKSDAVTKITTPVLFMTAGDERVVENADTRQIAARIPGARHVNIADSRHEILMEADLYRHQFWEYFDNFLPDCKIG